MALAKSRRGPAVNYWPGYVDMFPALAGRAGDVVGTPTVTVTIDVYNDRILATVFLRVGAWNQFNTAIQTYTTVFFYRILNLPFDPRTQCDQEFTLQLYFATPWYSVPPAPEKYWLCESWPATVTVEFS